MKTPSSKQFFLTLLVVTVLAAMTGKVSAQIIYQDHFNRNGILDGTSPDTVNTGGAVWKDNAALSTTSTANGGEVISGGGPNLPFAPSSGFIYTLSVDVIVTNANTSWIAIGYNTDINSASSPFSSPASMLLRGAADGGGNWVQAFHDGLNQYSANPGPTANGAGSLNNVKLVLDTTAAQWTISSYVNNLNVGMYTYTSNPTIGAVGFNFSTAATFSNFELSESSPSAAPEPSTYAMLLGGLVIVVFYVRRRRA